MKACDILNLTNHVVAEQQDRREPTLSVDAIIKAIQHMTPEQLQRLSGQSQQPPELHTDVSVVNAADPIVLRYKNQDYALADDDRTWVKFGTKKAAPAEMAKFLHKQLRAL